MPRNWEARDKKLDKRKNGMRTSGRSVFIIDEADKKRNAEKVARYDKLTKKKGKE